MRKPIFILLFAGLALAPGLTGPFIHDDQTNLALVMVDVQSMAEMVDVSMSNESGFLRRPVSNLSFLLNYLAAGEGSLSFKLVNLLFHVLNGWLLYLLLAQVLTRDTRQDSEVARGLALFAAAVWVAHPMNLSTVLYVVQRMTILSGTFTLAALLVLASTLRKPAASHSRQSIQAGLFLALVAFGLLCKENAALAPALAILVAMMCRTGPTSGFLRANRTLLSLTIVVPLIAGLAALLLRWESLVAGYSYRTFDLAERLATQTVVLWKYIGHAIAPWPPSMQFFWDHEPVRSFGQPMVWAAVAGWLLATLAALLLRKRSLIPLFCLLWFLGGHLMESTLLPLELAYEHRNYLPLVGPILGLCVLLESAGRRLNFPLRTAALALLALVMVLTATRAFTWSSYERLVAHEVRLSPKSARAQINAFSVALQSGRWEDARLSLETLRSLDSSSNWHASLELMLGCYQGAGPADMKKAARDLIASATDERTRRGVQQLTALERQFQCLSQAGIDCSEWLAKLRSRAMELGVDSTAADYAYMAASLAWSEGNVAETRKMLHESIRLAPAVSEPWEQLFAVEISDGRLDAAERAYRHLEQVYSVRQPWRFHRLKPMRALLDASAGTAGHPVDDRGEAG